LHGRLRLQGVSQRRELRLHGPLHRSAHHLLYAAFELDRHALDDGMERRAEPRHYLLTDGLGNFGVEIFPEPLIDDVMQILRLNAGDHFAFGGAGPGGARYANHGASPVQ
jgi:hypothetical protein